MKKTMIYLEEDLHQLLRKKAKIKGKSMAMIVREAVRDYLHKNREETRYFSFVGIAEGPQNEEISSDVDKYLRESLK